MASVANPMEWLLGQSRRREQEKYRSPPGEATFRLAFPLSLPLAVSVIFALVVAFPVAVVLPLALVAVLAAVLVARDGFPRRSGLPPADDGVRRDAEVPRLRSHVHPVRDVVVGE